MSDQTKPEVQLQSNSQGQSISVKECLLNKLKQVGDNFLCLNAVNVFLQLDLAFHGWDIQMEVLASHSAAADHLVHTVFWVSLILTRSIEI